jgi:hypothetical protein
MTAPTLENMDLACARAGKTIAEKPSEELKNLLQNALAVLEEQGVYALFLFLQARGGEDGKAISKGLHAFLKETPRQAHLLSDDADVFAALQKLAEDLDTLLLARDLLRQTLVYARYHASVPRQQEERS